MNIIDCIACPSLWNALRVKKEKNLTYIKVYLQDINGGHLPIIFEEVNWDYDPPDMILHGTCYIHREKYTYEFVAPLGVKSNGSIIGFKKQKQLMEVM